MGWVALIHHCTYEKAKEIADKYDLACVSTRQYERMRGEHLVKPIVTRVKNGKFWFNYYDDGSFSKTYNETHARTIKQQWAYAPYFYVPNKVHYVDLLKYYKQHLSQFKGVYKTYITYLTIDLEPFVYSVFDAAFNSPLNVPFDNPLLYFETGRPSRVVGRDKDGCYHSHYN